MERYREELTRIQNLLRAHPRGLTITDIARRIEVNRNSVAKYLDVLITSGHVEKKAVGPAKVYFLSPRVPVSALLNLSSDYIIMLDEKGKIWHVNNSVLSFEGRGREEVLGRDLDDAPLVLLMDPKIRDRLLHGPTEGEFSTEMDVKKGETMHHFRATLVCTVLEDGSRGTTVILQDITEEKRHQKLLQASEMKFRGLAERSFDIIFLFDKGGKITYISPSVEKVAGVPPERYIGTSFREYIIADDLPAAVQAFEKCRQGLSTESLLLKVKKPDGSIVTLETNTIPILKEGEFLGVQAVSRDVTLRLETEAALKESEEKFRSLFEAMTDGICLADERGIIIEANNAMAEISGIPRKEAIGRTLWDIAHRMINAKNLLPDFSERMRSDIMELLGTGRSSTLHEISEIPIRGPDGTRRTIQVRNFLIPSKEGNQMGSIIRDITNRKRMEDDLKATTRNLGERVKELQCLYSISSLLIRQDLPFEHILQEMAKILPSGMQAPASCGARIRMDGQEYRSPSFSETPWRLSQKIPGEVGLSGSIDVCYTSDISGPETVLFLEEEGQLLGEIALRLAEARQHRSSDETHSRLASIVEDAEEAIIGKSLEGNILSWNRAAERIYGYRADEVIGKPISLLLPDGYPDDISSILEKMRRGEKLEYFNTRRMRKDGQVIQVSLMISPVRDSNGRITGISTIAREISN